MQSETWVMFDKIARHYDQLNQILSLGMHKSWRKVLVSLVWSDSPQPAVLDMATGTGDVLLAIANALPIHGVYCGLDMSSQMLDFARWKIIRQQLPQNINLIRADASQTPFQDKSFDLITMSFGIRNVSSPLVVLKEMHRLLKTGGEAFILEFSLPTNPLIRFCALVYLRFIVPVIGGIISGHMSAYQYLTRSIEAFPAGENFCALLKQAGFERIHTQTLFFGMASIYRGLR